MKRCPYWRVCPYYGNAEVCTNDPDTCWTETKNEEEEDDELDE